MRSLGCGGKGTARGFSAARPYGSFAKAGRPLFMSPWQLPLSVSGLSGVLGDVVAQGAGGRGRRFCGARPALPALPRKTRRRRPKAAGVTARFPRPPPPPPGRSEPREERQALSFCQENNPLIQAQTCWKMFVSSCPFAASAWGVGVGMGSSGSISSMV